MNQEFHQLTSLLLKCQALEDITVVLHKSSFHSGCETAERLISFIVPKSEEYSTTKETMLSHARQQFQHRLRRQPDWVFPAVAVKVPIIV
jgi:hypothetical protein